jgi:hypothetical protein
MGENYYSISGFSKKQYVLVSLTESAGCVFESSEYCCYRTFDWVNKYTARVQVASSSATDEACLAGHSCPVSSYGGIQRYRSIRKCRSEDGLHLWGRELERHLSQEVSITAYAGKERGRFQDLICSFQSKDIPTPNGQYIQHSVAKSKKY